MRACEGLCYTPPEVSTHPKCLSTLSEVPVHSFRSACPLFLKSLSLYPKYLNKNKEKGCSSSQSTHYIWLSDINNRVHYIRSINIMVIPFPPFTYKKDTFFNNYSHCHLQTNGTLRVDTRSINTDILCSSINAITLVLSHASLRF